MPSAGTTRSLRSARERLPVGRIEQRHSRDQLGRGGVREEVVGDADAVDEPAFRQPTLVEPRAQLQRRHDDVAAHRLAVDDRPARRADLLQEELPERDEVLDEQVRLILARPIAGGDPRVTFVEDVVASGGAATAPGPGPYWMPCAYTTRPPRQSAGTSMRYSAPPSTPRRLMAARCASAGAQRATALRPDERESHARRATKARPARDIDTRLDCTARHRRQAQDREAGTRLSRRRRAGLGARGALPAEHAPSRGGVGAASEPRRRWRLASRTPRRHGSAGSAPLAPSPALPFFAESLIQDTSLGPISRG